MQCKNKIASTKETHSDHEIWKSSEASVSGRYATVLRNPSLLLRLLCSFSRGLPLLSRISEVPRSLALLLLRASQLSSPAQKRVIRAVRAVMDLGPSWPRWRASHSSRTLYLKAARASVSGQSTIWFFFTKNLVQSSLADSAGCWTKWLKSSASDGRTYVPWKLSRKASSRSPSCQ